MPTNSRRHAAIPASFFMTVIILRPTTQALPRFRRPAT
jgi:hypothetical protein